jgi:hypothetical protein
MPTLNLTLIQNSHSFVNEALAKAILAESEASQWQFAIFALVQSIELALKERLRRERPSLIFKNVDDRRQTVTIEQAANRLRDIAKVAITEADLSAIRTATQWRNLVVHYEFEFSIEVLKPVFARLLGFLTDFYQSHLGLFLADHVRDENWREAVSITDYGAELSNRAKLRFQSEKIDAQFVWTCPRCGNDTFVIQDNVNTCYVCNFQDVVAECENCGELFFHSDLHEVITLAFRDRETRKLLRDKCYEEHQWRESERFYDPDW